MFGTIRKHQNWLWAVIVAATVLSFVAYFNPSSRLGGGGGGGGAADFGRIGGERVSAEAYLNAKKEVLLRYFFNTGGHWPDDPAHRNPNFDLEKETYYWLLLIQQQQRLGIEVSLDQAAQYGRQMLETFRKAGITSPEVFLRNVLEPRTLEWKDFERFVRHTLGLEELAAVVGVSGKLVTPQEVKGLYVREHQEMSTTALFFSASNFLSSVSATPAELSQFYSNNLANYRIPERVQVNYVTFSLSNYLAEATGQLAKLTNLDDEVEMAYEKDKTNVLHDLNAKDLAEAKTKYRELRLKYFERQEADKVAREFADKVFDLSPEEPENLVVMAHSNGLPVQVSAPFDQEGPKDTNFGPNFAKYAFSLTPKDEPFAGPIEGENAVYIIGYFKRLPSEIPPLDQIREEVLGDYKQHGATELARKAGETAYVTLTNGLAQKKSFSAICVAAGLKPVELPPLSLSTNPRDLPEQFEAQLTTNQIRLNVLQQMAFMTPAGDVSEFRPTSLGGVILYVHSMLPIDEAKMQSQMPAYLAYVREQRQKQAFDHWFSQQASQDLRDIPAFQQRQAPSMSNRKS